MNKKKIVAVFLALIICGLASQAPAQGPEPKFNSNADDLAKIRGVLEEVQGCCRAAKSAAKEKFLGQ